MGSFFSNDSTFGRIMQRLWIIIGANLMFVIFSLPVVTIGASYTALYHVMLKMLRGNPDLSPIKEFWIGFKNNFKQSTIVWVIACALGVFLYFDIRLCRQFGGAFDTFIYLIYAIGIAALILLLYVLPVIAAFADTIPHLLRNALFFAVKRPFNVLVILFFNVFPLVLTYTDPQWMPLYGFIWVTCGYALVVLVGATLLNMEFSPYLAPVEMTPAEEEEAAAKASGKQSLTDMKKLGM